jgi:hypothetical protein
LDSGLTSGNLADLIIGDVLVGMLLVDMSATFREEFVVVLGFEMLPTQRTIGGTHGGLLSAPTRSGESLAGKRRAVVVLPFCRAVYLASVRCRARQAVPETRGT